MAETGRDFPTLENEAGISAPEREEIRSAIEKVVTENRIPVEAAQFSLQSARRGVLLPSIVNAAALAAVVAAVLILSVVFRRDERHVQNQVTQYASIEGKLIRELRQESQQLLGSKEKEIDEIKNKVRELEGEQKTLEENFTRKLKQREDELRQQLKQDLDVERARLTSAGVGKGDIEARMARFEAERKAYYERQLAEYRKQLEAERTQLQADITRLRAEYGNRLQQLEQERKQIVSDYQKREITLQVQLQQKTQVLDRLRTQTSVDLEAAQRELAGLNSKQEQVQTVENQIEGQIARIRDALGTGDAQAALSQVRSLQTYLQQGSVRAVPQLADRVRTDVFLLNQLGTLLEDRLKAQAAAGEKSLTSELELLSTVRTLSQQAAAGPAGPGRLDLYRQLIATMPEVQAASTALVEAAVTDLQKGLRDQTEENSKAAVALVKTGDYAGALARYKAALNVSPSIQPDSARLLSDLLVLGYSLSNYTQTGRKSAGTGVLAAQAGIDIEAERQAFLRGAVSPLADQQMTDAITGQGDALRKQISDAEARIAQLQTEKTQADTQHVAELDAVAARVKTTRQDLNTRLDALLAFEGQVNQARATYAKYVEQEKAARQSNPQDPTTASRQELNKFLRDDSVRRLFSDVSERVNALYAATQSAGSSAALADAQQILETVAKQPSVKAARQLLQFEMGNAAGNERLKAILSAIDGVLAKSETGAQ